MVERCAGLDVHRDDVVATVRVPGSGRGRWEQQTRTFRATLGGLAQLAAWLAEAGVTLVGMEATGVYWKTVFQALEDRFECWLLNAHHLRNVPGRKTDVKDSEWICQLVQHGLVRPSFVPPPEIRRLRDLTRLRRAQTNERARSIQRLEKVLQDAGIKLSSVASHTYSKSARAMLEALLSGVTDPEQLAELSMARMRLKIPQLREALASRFQIEHHGIMVAQLLAHIDTLDAALQNLTERIEYVLAPHAQIIELLCTIPRRPSARSAGPDRRMRPRHDPVPDRRALRVLGRSVPRPSPISRPATLGTNPPRTPLAHQSADRMRTSRRPHQRHLPRRSLRPTARPTRRAQSDRRDPSRPPRRLLPHHPRPSPIPRTRPRLAAQALLSQTPRPATATPTQSPRLRRHPRPNPPTRNRTSRPNQHNPAPRHRRRIARRKRLLPKRGSNPGIHRSASRAAGRHPSGMTIRSRQGRHLQGHLREAGPLPLPLHVSPGDHDRHDHGRALTRGLRGRSVAIRR